MKIYNSLSIIILTIIFVACKDKNKDNQSGFSFDSSVIKDQYLNNETLKIAIKNLENKKIDSITYFFNNKKIETNKNANTKSINLEQEKCGEKNLKALVYFGGENSEATARVELVSNVQPKLLKYKIVNTFPHDTTSFISRRPVDKPIQFGKPRTDQGVFASGEDAPPTEFLPTD